MKKYIASNALNIADTFNQVTKFTVADGLISAPFLLYSGDTVVINPFTFIHNGTIVEVDTYAQISSSIISTGNFYLYVDSNGSDPNIPPSFYVTDGPRDALVLVAEFKNGAPIYPPLVNVPGLRRSTAAYLGNKLKGNIAYEKNTNTLLYNDLKHYFGLDITNLGQGFLNLPNIIPGQTFGVYALVAPDLEVIPWQAYDNSFDPNNPQLFLGFATNILGSKTLQFLEHNSTIIVSDTNPIYYIQLKIDSATYDWTVGTTSASSIGGTKRDVCKSNNPSQYAGVSVAAFIDSTSGLTIQTEKFSFDGNTITVGPNATFTNSAILSGAIEDIRILRGEVEDKYYIIVLIAAGTSRFLQFVQFNANSMTFPVSSLVSDSSIVAGDRFSADLHDSKIELILYSQDGSSGAYRLKVNAQDFSVNEIISNYFPAGTVFHEFKYHNDLKYEIYGYIYNDGTDNHLSVYYNSPVGSRKVFDQVYTTSYLIDGFFVGNDACIAVNVRDISGDHHYVKRVGVNAEFDSQELQVAYNFFKAVFLHTGHIGLTVTDGSGNYGLYLIPQNTHFEDYPGLGRLYSILEYGNQINRYFHPFDKDYNTSAVYYIGNGRESIGDYNIETIEELVTKYPELVDENLVFLPGYYKVSGNEAVTVTVDATNGIHWKAEDRVYIDTNDGSLKFDVNDPSTNIDINLENFNILTLNGSRVVSGTSYIDRTQVETPFEIRITSNNNEKKININLSKLKICDSKSKYASVATYASAVKVYSDPSIDTGQINFNMKSCIVNGYYQPINFQSAIPSIINIDNNEITLDIENYQPAGYDYYYDCRITGGTTYVSINENVFYFNYRQGTSQVSATHIGAIYADQVGDLVATSNKFYSTVIGDGSSTNLTNTFAHPVLNDKKPLGVFEDLQYSPEVKIVDNIIYTKIQKNDGTQFTVNGDYYGPLLVAVCDKNYLPSAPTSYVKYPRFDIRDNQVKRPPVGTTGSINDNVILFQNYVSGDYIVPEVFWAHNAMENGLFIKGPGVSNIVTCRYTAVGGDLTINATSDVTLERRGLLEIDKAKINTANIDIANINSAIITGANINDAQVDFIGIGRSPESESGITLDGDKSFKLYATQVVNSSNDRLLVFKNVYRYVNWYGQYNLNSKGVLKIKTPFLLIDSSSYPSGLHPMAIIKIKGYHWDGGTAAGIQFWELDLHYDYWIDASGSKWRRPGAILKGNAPFSRIRFAQDTSGYAAIYLGDTNTVWPWAHIIIDEVRVEGTVRGGWGNANAWSISIISDEDIDNSYPVADSADGSLDLLKELLGPDFAFVNMRGVGEEEYSDDSGMPDRYLERHFYYFSWPEGSTKRSYTQYLIYERYSSSDITNDVYTISEYSPSGYFVELQVKPPKYARKIIFGIPCLTQIFVTFNNVKQFASGVEINTADASGNLKPSWAIEVSGESGFYQELGFGPTLNLAAIPSRDSCGDNPDPWGQVIESYRFKFLSMDLQGTQFLRLYPKFKNINVRVDMDPCPGSVGEIHVNFQFKIYLPNIMVGFE